LCLGDDSIDADTSEEVIEEHGHFLDVKGTVAICIVFVEDRLNVIFDHLVLK